MSDFYDHKLTEELKTRRCHWVADKCDLGTALLIQDGFHQLELADTETLRLHALCIQQALELQRQKEDSEHAWEIVAAHTFPVDYAETDEDWSPEDTGSQAIPASSQNNA